MADFAKTVHWCFRKNKPQGIQMLNGKENSLGKGEVVSSILPGSTKFPLQIRHFGNFTLGAYCCNRAERIASSAGRLRRNPRNPSTVRSPTIAALYVAKSGCYFGLPGVDPWDLERDARTYAGPWPVVAHPPCERWGRFWHGSTRKPHQFKLGDDDGCFVAALAAVRRWGGVIEHPTDSHAWGRFGLNAPSRHGGWIAADFQGGWTCCVEQGRYGHMANKPTWLYAFGTSLPDLRWGRGEQRLHPIALAKHGYAKARRIGMMAMVGGKHKKQIRDASPIEFRDLLISIARTARPTHA